MIVANPDSYWPSLRLNGMGIGSGAVARFICQVLADAGKEVKPLYLGKPYPPIYQCVFPFLRRLFPERSFDDPSRLVMVGDSLKSDIAGANTNGITSALVLSGITNLEMVENVFAEEQPKMIFSGV
jgi:ribonucleotide monophosphatase NagD (HAD superfamily)